MMRPTVSRTAFLAAGVAAGMTLGTPPRAAPAQTASTTSPTAPGATAPPAAPPPAAPATRILVLSGGTAYGAYEAGVLDGLGDQPPYDYICGTSIGALNGGVIATGQLAKLRYLWRNIASIPVLEPKRAYRHVLESSAGVGTRVFEGVELLLDATSGSLTGFMQSEPVRAILRDVFVDDGKLRDFVTPLYWTASNLTRGCAGFFSRGSSGPRARLASVSRERLDASLLQLGFTTRASSTVPAVFVEQLRASSAIPAVFEPALTAPSPTDTLVDGGITNNTPFALVRAAARTGPVAVDTVLLGSATASHQPSDTRNIAGIVEACFDLMQQRLIDDAVRALASDAQQFRTLRESQRQLQELVDAHAESLRSLDAAASPAARTRSTAAVQRSTALQTAALSRANALVAGAPVAQEVTIRFRAPSRPLTGSGFDFTDQRSVDANYDLGKADIEQLGWSDFTIPADLCSLNGR